MSLATRQALTAAENDLNAAADDVRTALAGYMAGDPAAKRTAVDDAVTAWTAAADAYDLTVIDWLADR